MHLRVTTLKLESLGQLLTQEQRKQVNKQREAIEEGHWKLLISLLLIDISR